MIPFHKIYFILYNPGGCGSFVQNLLQVNKKYSGNTSIKFDFTDGTAHAVKNDCFNNFHGIDINKNMHICEPWHDKEIAAL